MSFNPDLKKEIQGVVFPKKSISKNHPSIFFNKIPPQSFQNHLRCTFRWKKLNYGHAKAEITHASKGIYAIHRNALLIIYKSFVRPLI